MISELIENDIDISAYDSYAVIIGEFPSKGARSPKLWNAVFKEQKINSRMVPLDVKRNNIIKLLNELSNDPRFMGGAIAVPYKETVAKWLNRRVTKEAKKIGAVNCLYRNKDSCLSGANTDGEAAIKTFQDKFGSVKEKSVTVLGCGGAGKAVAAYFLESVGERGAVTIISRKASDKNYAQKIGSKWNDWSGIDDYSKSDILINCTSIGFGDQENDSPLSEKQILTLKYVAVIFDVVYQPLETKLLLMAMKHNKHIINGLNMNLEQAVIAFAYCSGMKKDNIRTIMEKIEV